MSPPAAPQLCAAHRLCAARRLGRAGHPYAAQGAPLLLGWVQLRACPRNALCWSAGLAAQFPCKFTPGLSHSPASLRRVQVPMHIVVGSPIEVPHLLDPSPAEVEAHLQQYIAALQSMFERRKAAAGHPRARLTVM